MKALKSARTLAASLGVLAVSAMAASPAMAFDDVHWSWYDFKFEKEIINVHVDINLEPTGLVQIEKLQIYFGDVTAEANVVGVVNDQSHNGEWRDIYVNCYCKYSIWVPTVLDADDLPEVKNAASAFGNLQVITADVPIFLHDGQFLADIEEDPYRDGYTGFVDLLKKAGTYNGTGNLHTDLALAFIYGSVYGLLDKAEITANANVVGVVNASVDNSAIAAGNLIQATIESSVDGVTTTSVEPCDQDACTPGPTPDPVDSNHFLQADITQFAYADVKATANVLGVLVSNYSGLGTLDRPLVNNAATAIGNGVIVNVGPVVDN